MLFIYSHCRRGAVVCVFAAASACGPAIASGPPRILAISSPDAPYDIFPIAHGAGGDVTPCAATPDSTIPYQRIVTESHYLGALSLRLPSTYVPRPPVDAPARLETSHGLFVAGWQGPMDVSADASQAGRARRRARGVSAWVEPQSELPTIGADPHTRQISFVECPPSGTTHRARMALFTLVTNADTTAYLTAVWPVPSGRYLQVVASAPHMADLAPVERALLDAVTEPRV